MKQFLIISILVLCCSATLAIKYVRGRYATDDVYMKDVNGRHLAEFAGHGVMSPDQKNYRNPQGLRRPVYMTDDSAEAASDEIPAHLLGPADDTVPIKKALAAGGKGPLVIKIYVEALCPGSKRLMKELKKINAVYYKHLDLLVNIRGFINEESLPGGDYKFTCQNGVAECVGNLLLNCGQKYSKNYQQYIGFAICVMSGFSPLLSCQECAEERGMPYEKINNCSIEKEGRILLHNAGLVMQKLNPPMTHVPWILINGKHVNDLPEMKLMAEHAKKNWN